MQDKPTLLPDYFQNIFLSDPDPWNFETSPYEASKYQASISALENRRYGRSLEVGCANGVLTRRLAGCCDRLFAIDVSDAALAKARDRNSDLVHVDFANMVFPKQSPEGLFDLIVLSEVVYYWSKADIAAAAFWIDRHLDAGGDLLLVHWTGETDYPQTGDGAVRSLREGLSDFSIVRASRHDNYRLDLWRK